ncbi:tetratricopeptide repeat protein [Nonomuraea sp. PA05]|uniref:tetratricopeptide repeat protein n=1 Tax=Nonomuraea sp. PA05 TaxID=2604466 RepID=UPI001651D522|nr:tetratricopeptide repeat protein [Nonomuraea sp. PA05]
MLAYCAGLPLAVCIVAARAVMRPEVPLKVLAGELGRERGRLRALATGDGGDTDISAVFSWSYQALPADAGALFRLLGVHPGPDLGVAAAASLAGLAEADAAGLLAELARASLLARDATERFRCHDLLRAYATQLSADEDGEEERTRALHRTLDHYLHTAYSAALLLSPGREPPALPRPRAGVTLHRPQDVEQAMAWFTREHANLLAAVRRAAGHGFDEHAWRLAEACGDFFDRQGHWHDWLAALRIALAASEKLGDRGAQARTRRDLGLACTRLSRYAEAETHFAAAIETFHDLGDPVGEARAHIHLSYVREEEEQLLDALASVERASRLFLRAGHGTGQATALDTMANYRLRLGDDREALSLAEQALGQFQSLEDPYGEASAWDNAGRAHHGLGRPGTAVTCFRKALCLCRQVHDRYGEAYILHHLGDSLLVLGDGSGAGEAWSQALDIMRELGHRDTEELRAKVASLG